MNANEQALMDGVTFLLDHRSLLKANLNEAQIKRLNQVTHDLNVELEKSIDSDPIWKDLGIGTGTPWSGSFKSHQDFIRTGPQFTKTQS